MIRSLLVVSIKINVSPERPRTPARRLRKSDVTTPHPAAAHRQAAIPNLSKHSPGYSNCPETKINRAEDDLGQANGA